MNDMVAWQGTTTRQNHVFSQISTREQIEEQIKGRRFTSIDPTTKLNYNAENGKVFHNPRELDPIIDEEVTNAAYVTAGTSCFGIGALLHQPLCWIAGAAIVFGKMPGYWEAALEHEDNRDYIDHTRELENKLRDIIAQEKKNK
jgi:hypothetical protein